MSTINNNSIEDLSDQEGSKQGVDDPDTEDRIFLLSIGEERKYVSDWTRFIYNDELPDKIPTEYAISHGAAVDSEGHGIAYVRSFSQDGSSWGSSLGDLPGEKSGVRSALWVYTGDVYYEEEEIKTAQENLNAKGYDCGTPDGIMGNMTMKALKDYQKDNNLCVTGVLTDETAISLSVKPESNDEPDNGYIEISTAEELASIEDNLKGDYILTSDIDLGGAEWVPVGGDSIHVPAESIPNRADYGYGDEEEITLVHSFYGTFDGCNHTISNFTIHQPDDYDGAGLFGSLSSATIKDLTVKNVTINGKNNVSAIAGSASDSTIKNVTAENVVINAEPGEEGSNVCFGAIVGSGSNNNLVDCGAQATINLTDDCYFAGIIAGNVQDDTSIINCTGFGIINANARCIVKKINK